MLIEKTSVKMFSCFWNNTLRNTTLQIDKGLHLPLYYYKHKRIVIWR